MTKRAPRATRSFTAELPHLLQERGLSLRRLADLVHVNDSHLSRVVRGINAPSVDLIERVARELKLPDDYFGEVREQRLIEALQRDPRLRDRLYDRNVRGR